MKFTFSTGGAVAAAAAVLALAAVSAQAREADNPDSHGWQQRAAVADERAQAKEAREQAAAQARADRAEAHQEQRTAQPQRNWTDGRQQQQQRTYVPQAPQEKRTYTPRAREQQQRPYTPYAQTQQRPQWNDSAQRTQPRPQWSGSAQRTQQRRQWNGSAQTERNSTYDSRDRTTTYRNSGGSWGANSGGDRSYGDGQRNNHHWDRSWRNNNRYDWQRYRSTNRNVYHAGHYYAPYRNYSYRRLGIGFYLDSLFFGQNYWIADPFYYRLPEVYGPYRWVRYYDDALLVDIYSGEVVDVIYDFFW